MYNNEYEGSFEQYAREESEKGNFKPLEEHYKHEDRLAEIRKGLVKDLQRGQHE